MSRRRVPFGTFDRLDRALHRGSRGAPTLVHQRLTHIKDEVRRLAGVAAFFVAATCLVVFTDKLVAWNANVETATFATALVAGLVIAKVLMLVDLLPVMSAGADWPLAYRVAQKAPIYIVAVLAFRYVERFVHHLVSGASLSAASALALRPFEQPAFWATVIWLVVLLLVFLTTQELGRILGKDRMRLIFFGR